MGCPGLGVLARFRMNGLSGQLLRSNCPFRRFLLAASLPLPVSSFAVGGHEYHLLASSHRRVVRIPFYVEQAASLT